MTAAELVTCCVPEDPAYPILAGEYIMACMAFYERGFGVPSYRFLCSLLQFYGLELHHLTPSGILHMVAFVTLCEAYMGIDVIPHSKIAGMKPSYVCPRCFIHTYSNNMINRFHVQYYKYLFITK
jgi:hypothetical protein